MKKGMVEEKEREEGNFVRRREELSLSFRCFVIIFIKKLETLTVEREWGACGGGWGGGRKEGYL